jgi:transcriptional regulator with PAS, ATPase and Fis domain
MSSLVHIQPFVENCARDLSEVLGLDVTILDENGTRISGTGYYKDLIGKPAPEGSFFRMILQTGEPGIIHGMKKNDAHCMGCKFKQQCQELATIGFPVFKRNKPIGVIGVVGFSPEQKEKMVHNSEKLIRFLSHLSTLLENRMVLIDYSTQSECNLKEDIPLLPKKVSFESIIGQDSGIKDTIQKARRIANSISTVLIRGESGTGKEVLAKAIHGESSRSKYPFIAVNCAAIPENLLESELFGYEGGAFTGAKREGNIGKFELAHKGTLFLDEIGDMPLSLQAKLLRVLQDRLIERVGGRRSIPIDVRVITATNRNLEEMMRNGTFREDLYYRINVIPLRLKSLKERREDIHLFLQFFTKKFCGILNKGSFLIDPLVEHWLIQYDWPGNIRQLENAVEYMINMAETEVIGFKDLPDYLFQQDPPIEINNGSSLDEMVSEYEKSILESYFLLDNYRNNKPKIASELKISVATLYRKLEKYQLI